MFLQDDRLAADHAKAASIDAKTTLPDSLMMDSIAARAAGEKLCPALPYPALQGPALFCPTRLCPALHCPLTSRKLPCPARTFLLYIVCKGHWSFLLTHGLQCACPVLCSVAVALHTSATKTFWPLLVFCTEHQVLHDLSCHHARGTGLCSAGPHFDGGLLSTGLYFGAGPLSAGLHFGAGLPSAGLHC